MNDSLLKNTLRNAVKLITKSTHDKYCSSIVKRSKNLPYFTLFTSDCMAGLIYHTMGRQFLSPTINLTIEDKGFLRFLTDIQGWLSKDIHFIESNDYPRGYLGDIDNPIYMNFHHYKTEEEVLQKWNDRKKRINYDNMFIVAADLNLSDEDINQFKLLNNYYNFKRKVMFTWNKDREDGKEIFFVKSYGRQRIKHWSKIRPDGFRDYELFFDYVAWLNMEDKFLLDK